MTSTEKQTSALEQFSGNLNCAQSVLSAYADDFDIKQEDLEKIAAAFGGGMGEGEICGTVTASLMVLGLKFGHTQTSYELKEQLEVLTQEFKTKFEHEFGSLKCKDLIGYNLKNQEDYDKALLSGVFDSKCPVLIKKAIAIIDQIVSGEV